MAIKWKNNSKITIVAVLLLSMLAGTVMCNLYPLFRQRAEAYRADRMEKTVSDERTPIRMDEAFQRFMRSSVYYMDYKTTPYYEYDYFSQNYNVKTLTPQEKDALTEMAETLLGSLEEQYHAIQEVNGFSSFVYGGDRSCGGGALTDALRDVAVTPAANPDSAALDLFQAGIAISYDSRGLPSVKEAWGFEYDSAEVERYLREATVGALMEDNGVDYNYYREETPETEETPEESEIPEISEMPEGEAVSPDDYAVMPDDGTMMQDDGTEQVCWLPWIRHMKHGGCF